MKRLAAVAFLFAAFSAFAGVRKDMVVTTDWVEKNRFDVKIVHVGKDRLAYNEGHVPGAIFMPLASLVTNVALPNELPALADLQADMEAAGIDNATRLVVYGDDPLYAARFFFTLDYLGMGNKVAIMDGGLSKWKAENRPLESPMPIGKLVKFKAKPDDKKVVTHEEAKQVVAANSVLLIDARPEAEFSGETPGEGITRGGHMPGAKNVPWKKNLNEDGTLLAPDKLEALYAIPKGKQVVTYCRTGNQASLTYFVLRYLGHDVAMYDGSFIQWSNDAGTAVEQ